jgi:hypothetical protein
MGSMEIRYLWDLLKQQDLSQFLEQHAKLALQQRTGGWWRLCPFHEENTPSFSVFCNREGVWFFKCFGCQEGGTIIDFCIRFYKDLHTPREAALFLAERLQIPIDDSLSLRALEQQRVNVNERDRLDCEHIQAASLCRMVRCRYLADTKVRRWVLDTCGTMDRLLSDGDVNGLRKVASQAWQLATSERNPHDVIDEFAHRQAR